MLKIIYFAVIVFAEIVLLRGEIWKEDVSSAMKIGLSTTGYQSVDLRCDAEHFAVNVTLNKDFEGVVYTRGSFNDKKPPCFQRHDQNDLLSDDRLRISLKIPFHGCRTIMDVAESRYTNTLVVQHDPDLIMPGDAAFSLDCAFVPEFKTSADISATVNVDAPFKSKITLVDADPSEKSKSKSEERNFTVASQSETVSFTPNLGPAKDEL